MTRAAIDDNHHKGLLARNSVSGEALDLTGDDLTTANPLHVSIVDSVGTQITSFGTPSSSTATKTSVTATTTSGIALASNTARRGATIQNEGSAIAFLAFGTTASTSSYTIQIASGGYYEFPYNYTGAVSVITSAGTAVLRITELT